MWRLEALLVLTMGLRSSLGAASGRVEADSRRPGTEEPRTPLPPGHPSVTGPGAATASIAPDDENDRPLPPGHPMDSPTPARGIPGAFSPPADSESEDSTRPGGTIEVEVRDPENHPLSDVELTLGILHQSVAKGESREHKLAVADSTGICRFNGLETGSGIAYRVTILRDGATFAAVPLQLPAQRGMRIVLHVYPVSKDIQETLIVSQGALFVEIKDDRVQIEEAFTIFNIGRIAWLADGVLMRLPWKRKRARSASKRRFT